MRNETNHSRTERRRRRRRRGASGWSALLAAAAATTTVVSLLAGRAVAFGGAGPPVIVPPVLGLGALFFRPRGMVIKPSLGDEDALIEAGEFFTDAFWAGKAGGAAELAPFQRSSIERQQVLEFRRRYGPNSGRSTNPADRRAELLLCRDASGTFLGCAGIEVDNISKADGRTAMGGRVQAPLMSNLAVGKKFRRKGVAEELVKQAEDLARREWGYDECYLYVEKRNAAAVKLYRKLGYRQVWEDDMAKTLVPTEGGKLRTAGTVIICMKKKLGGIGRFLPF